MGGATLAKTVVVAGGTGVYARGPLCGSSVRSMDANDLFCVDLSNLAKKRDSLRVVGLDHCGSECAVGVSFTPRHPKG